MRETQIYHLLLLITESPIEISLPSCHFCALNEVSQVLLNPEKNDVTKAPTKEKRNTRRTIYGQVTGNFVPSELWKSANSSNEVNSITFERISHSPHYTRFITNETQEAQNIRRWSENWSEKPFLSMSYFSVFSKAPIWLWNFELCKCNLMSETKIVQIRRSQGGTEAERLGGRCQRLDRRNKPVKRARPPQCEEPPLPAKDSSHHHWASQAHSAQGQYSSNFPWLSLLPKGCRRHFRSLN